MQGDVYFTAFGIPPALWLLAERPKAGVVGVAGWVARLARLARWVAAAGSPVAVAGWLASVCKSFSL